MAGRKKPRVGRRSKSRAPIDPIWEANRVPDGFWAEPENRRAYMKWLGEKLGYKKPNDWYQVKKSTFYTNRGGGLLANYYGDSPQAAVREYLPRIQWKDWLFKSVRQGFWKKRENRIAYLQWLGKKLGYKTLEDWYDITQAALINNNGAALLHGHYGGSVIRAVRELFPEDEWTEWRFRSVPQRFWKNSRNRKRYVQWLGQKLGYHDHNDWAHLAKKDFRQNGGGGLLAEYYHDSPLQVLRRHLPGHNWKKLRQPILTGQKRLFHAA